ncbi:MAG TPA: ABC transporter permease [Pyrinomonadaceae bacterium]|jgi:putative ABC transport system permease protein|nr:ABC transporter permease [Pyrinomonadaceae bacterium]
MGALLRDLRYGARMLWQKPGFTLVAVLTLGFGIGANTAIFTVVDAALLRPLPFKEPARLVHLWETTPQQQQEFNEREASYSDYLDWRGQTQVFEDLAGYSYRSFALTGGETPERIAGAAVTDSFFKVLGVEPVLGRSFQDGDARAGAPRLVMMSYGLWQTRFGGNPDIIGQSLVSGGNTYTVIGVLPQSFKFAPTASAELWTPLIPSPDQLARRSWHWLHVIGRLKPGLTIEQGQAEMAVIARAIAHDHPESHTGTGIRLVSLHEQIVGKVKPVLFALLGTVCFVLLIACANVANLLLARAAARQKEIAIRTAMGAGRWRLIRQLLTESILLSMVGGALGLLLAQWGVDLLVAAIPDSQLSSMPYLQGLGMDGRVLVFTLAVTLMTGLVFGLAPAFQSSKLNLQESLKEGGRTSGAQMRQRLRNLLVVAEVALALVLLVGAGLMMKSLLRLLAVDPGFNPENLLTMQVALPAAKYRDDGQVIAFHQQLLARVESLPGVKGVGTVSLLPMVGGDTVHIKVEGRPAPPPGEETEVNFRNVTPSYFGVMSIPLIRGRGFTDRDKQDTPAVTMINQTMANRLFPGQDPVGQRISFASVNSPPIEIVGVVGDEKVNSLDTATTPVLYVPYLQNPDSYLNLVIRTTSEPESLARSVRGEIQSLDPELPVFGVKTMEQLIDSAPSTFLRRYPAFLIGVFAGVALLLAMVGIYGVISYSVTQRTHEIGVRMALGAQRWDILKMVLGHGLILTLAGVGCGLGAALVLTRFLSSLLFGVTATDPLTYVVVSLPLIFMALLACYVPARRAMKVDPMVALRYE